MFYYVCYTSSQKKSIKTVINETQESGIAQSKRFCHPNLLCFQITQLKNFMRYLLKNFGKQTFPFFCLYRGKLLFIRLI